MSRLSKLVGFALVAGLVASANATVISFSNLADNILGEGPISSYTTGGLTITFTAMKGANNASAYLDFGNAGLGVCGQTLAPSSNPSVNECNPSSDDNITVGEFVTLKFSKDVTITNTSYNNNHDGGLGAGNKILVNGVAKGTVLNSSLGVVNDSYVLGAGTGITYGYCNQQYYLSSITVEAVPEPTTLGLFGLGLAMVGFAIYRRKGVVA